MAAREQNESRFGQWEELSNGGRRYLKRVAGHTSRFALYVKEVDANEITVLFRQEIYNARVTSSKFTRSIPSIKNTNDFLEVNYAGNS